MWKANTKKFGNYLCPIATIGVFFLYYCLWINQVNPSPDRDGLNHFYRPLLTYLKSTDLTIDNFSCYPHGFLIFIYPLKLLGLESLLLFNPWYIHILLIIPIVFIGFNAPIRKSAKPYFTFALFFFPPIQLCLKTFNAHAYCVIYSILAIVLYVKFTKRRSKYTLAGSILCFWIACSFKHLGILILILTIITKIILDNLNQTKWSLESYSIILSLVFAFPFYVSLQNFEYLRGTSEHNLNLQLLIILLAAYVLVSLCICYFFLVKKIDSIKPVKRVPLFRLIFHSGFMIVTCLINFGLYYNFVLTLICFWSVIFIYLKFYINRSDMMSWITFVNLELAYILFFSRFGESSFVFFTPLTLLLIEAFKVYQSKKLYLVVCILFFGLSNFGSDYDAKSWDIGLYQRGYNVTAFNPFSWSKSGFNHLDSYIEELVSLQIEKKGMLTFISPNVPYTIFPFITRPNFMLYDKPFRQFGEELGNTYSHEIDVVVIDNDVKLYVRHFNFTLGNRLLVFHAKILRYFKTNGILESHYKRFDYDKLGYNYSIYIRK